MNEQTFIDRDKITDLFSICSSTQAGVLGLLASSSSLEVDAAPFLEALASELRKSDKQAVQHLASKCREGGSLIEVMEAGSGFFPSGVVLAVRLAHDSGTLDEFCESISKRPIYQQKMQERQAQSPLRSITSILSRGFTFFWVMTFAMLFIIPQFAQMFEEFGIELPVVTVLLIHTSNVFARYWYIFFAIAFILMAWYLKGSYRKILRVFSPSRWNQIEHPPAVQAKLNLAWISDSGLEFTKGLETMAQSEHNKRIRSKIEKAAARTAAGQGPWKALEITGVLSNKESKALEAAQSAETQSWLLRQLAAAQSIRRKSWSVTRLRLFTTLANIVLGVFVLLFCVGMFAPLIQIIRGLAG